jgi:hypothetical protein
VNGSKKPYSSSGSHFQLRGSDGTVFDPELKMLAAGANFARVTLPPGKSSGAGNTGIIGFHVYSTIDTYGLYWRETPYTKEWRLVCHIAGMFSDQPAWLKS